MRWKVILWAVVIPVLIAGCGGGGAEEGEAQSSLMARGISDGADARVSTQVECPVCGNPIKADIHTDSREKRVYFDKKACLQKWKKNKKKYMQNLMDQKLGPMGGGTPDKQSTEQ